MITLIILGWLLTTMGSAVPTAIWVVFWIGAVLWFLNLVFQVAKIIHDHA